MYLFMNMLFQRRITPTPKDPTPTQGNFEPRHEPLIYDHEHDHDHDYDHDHSH